MAAAVSTACSTSTVSSMSLINSTVLSVIFLNSPSIIKIHEHTFYFQYNLYRQNCQTNFDKIFIHRFCINYTSANLQKQDSTLILLGINFDTIESIKNDTFLQKRIIYATKQPKKIKRIIKKDL